MPTLRAGWGAFVAAAGFLAYVSWLPTATAAPAGAELQKLVRASTFEVVMRKVEKDPLTYEKPLPLELLPFAERNDKYWSVGTAFAIGPNMFVTATHVVQSGLGSGFGPPSLRDGQGNVFPIDRVLKYSMHEDFTVFSVVKPPGITPLATNTQPVVDNPVYAVGNALGDGIVIRDGLLTSMTPEEQDGRWKWLRFSAAASPGNSGGPLLDESGKVIGIVIGRSEGENLNFALPIERVLNDDGKAGRMDTRVSLRLPVLATGDVAVIKDSFSLPLTYPEFVNRFLQLQAKFYEAEQARLLALRADELFPRGQSAKLLASNYYSGSPSAVVQDRDRIWDAEEGSNKAEADFGDEGHVSVQYLPEIGLFQMRFPGAPSDGKLYADPDDFIDSLIRVLKITRTIGEQQIRVTSMGEPLLDKTHVDRFSRKWQYRAWAFGFVDIQVITFALPTPDGYVGMVRYSTAMGHDSVVNELKLIADYFQAPYSGTLKQWQAFMKRPDSAAALKGLKLETSPDSGLKLSSSRVDLKVPAQWLPRHDDASLTLYTTLMADGSTIACDVGKVRLDVDGKGKSYVLLSRQAKPASGVGKDVTSRWENMLNRSAEYSGAPGHDSEFKSFWVRGTAGAKASGGSQLDRDTKVLYEIAYQTADRMLPREMEERRDELFQSVVVRER